MSATPKKPGKGLTHKGLHDALAGRLWAMKQEEAKKAAEPQAKEEEEVKHRGSGGEETREDLAAAVPESAASPESAPPPQSAEERYNEWLKYVESFDPYEFTMEELIPGDKEFRQLIQRTLKSTADDEKAYNDELEHYRGASGHELERIDWVR